MEAINKTTGWTTHTDWRSETAARLDAGEAVELLSIVIDLSDKDVAEDARANRVSVLEQMWLNVSCRAMAGEFVFAGRFSNPRSPLKIIEQRELCYLEFVTDPLSLDLGILRFDDGQKYVAVVGFKDLGAAVEAGCSVNQNVEVKRDIEPQTRTEKFLFLLETLVANPNPALSRDDLNVRLSAECDAKMTDAGKLYGAPITPEGEKFRPENGDKARKFLQHLFCAKVRALREQNSPILANYNPTAAIRKILDDLDEGFSGLGLIASQASPDSYKKLFDLWRR